MTSIKPRASRRHSYAVKQPYRILIGSTGEPSSLGALRLGVALARRKSAVVHVLTVAKPFPHAVPSVFNIGPPAVLDEDNRRAAIELLRQRLSVLRGTQGWTLRATVGFAADSLIEAAARWPASLILVGIGNHGFTDRLMGSETAVAIARRAPVPMLAVPADATNLPTRAIAAIDFTDSSVQAAMHAATMLGANGRLTLIHASVLAMDQAEPDSLLSVYTTGARDKLQEVANRIRRRTKRQVSYMVVRGETGEQLLAHAAAEKCDLIALGSHAPSVLDHILGGSVRAHVLRSAGCSVLIAPPPTARTK